MARNQPIGTAARQGQGGPFGNLMDTYLSMQKIQSMKQDRATQEETLERARKGDIRQAGLDLQAQQEKTRASNEDIVNHAAQGVYGTDYAKDKSFGPYVEPTANRFRSGEKTSDVVNEPGKPGGILLDRPMVRSDVVAGMQRGRQKYDTDVQKAESTFGEPRQVPVGDEVGITRRETPAEQITQRAKIFPIAPGNIELSVNNRAIASGNIRGERVGAETEPLVKREVLAKTRTQEAQATQQEAQVADIPLDRTIKSLQRDILVNNEKISRSTASTIDEKTRLELDTTRLNNRIHTQQLQDLTQKSAMETRIRQMVEGSNGDPNILRQAMLLAGGSGAEWTLNDSYNRLKTSLELSKNTSAYIERIREDLGRGKPEDIQAANASVMAMNQMEDSKAKLIDKVKDGVSSVTVYSIYTIPGKIYGETNKLGMENVPRPIKDKIDSGQTDPNNPQDLLWITRIKASAIKYEPTLFTRAIELEGQSIGASGEAIATAKQMYLGKIQQIQGQQSQTANPNVSINPQTMIPSNVDPTPYKQRAIQKGKEAAAKPAFVPYRDRPEFNR